MSLAAPAASARNLAEGGMPLIRLRGVTKVRDLQNSSTQPNLPLREAQKKLRAPPKRLEDQGIEV